MTTFLAGSSLEVFTTRHVNLNTDTGTTERDTTYTLSSVIINANGFYGETKMVALAAETNIFFHHEHYQANGYTSAWQNPYEIVVGGTTMFRFRATGAAGTNGIEVEYWNGSTFVSMGNFTTNNGGNGTRAQIDVWIKKHASTGFIRVFFNQVEVTSVTNINTTSFFGNTILRFGRAANANNVGISQILIANYNTLTAKVKQTAFTANGAVQEWTGTYAEIDEVVANYADVLTTDVADEISTFKSAARTVTGFGVRSVGVIFNALKGGEDAPPNIRGVLRISGTNYYTANVALGYGAYGFPFMWDTNPSTSGTWNLANAIDANLEFGLQARS